MEEINILLENLDNNKIEIIRTLNDGFEEQEKYNADFFNKILDLIKSEIRAEYNEKNEKLDKIINKLEHSSELNKKITDELLYRLSDIKLENEEEKENKIIYSNLKKGIKQFSIQLGIVVSILLMILGSAQLIKLIF